MELRGVRRLRSILHDVAPAHRLVPLNVVVPPFQTGVRLREAAIPRLRRIESALQRLSWSLHVCDQVVWIWRAPDATA
jgi:hypothetical protein